MFDTAVASDEDCRCRWKMSDDKNAILTGRTLADSDIVVSVMVVDENPTDALDAWILLMPLLHVRVLRIAIGDQRYDDSVLLRVESFRHLRGNPLTEDHSLFRASFPSVCVSLRRTNRGQP